jgi:hypothetical protein
MIIAKYDEGDFSKIQEVIARKFKRVAEINDTLYHSENNFVSITHDHIGGTNLGIEIKEENKRIFNNHREKYSQQVETKYNLNDLILEIGREEYGPMEVVKIMHSNRSEDREKVKKWLEIAKRRINAVVSK